MCARKIKANVHRHSVSPVVGVHVTSALATPANPVHFICSLSLPRCMAINSSGRFRFSSYRSSELLSLDVDVRSQTNPNFFIFIWLQKNILLLQLLFLLSIQCLCTIFVYCRIFRLLSSLASHLCTQNAKYKYNNNKYNLFEELLDEVKTKKAAAAAVMHTFRFE